VATGPSADELARLNSVAEDIEIATIIVDGRIRRDFSHVPALAESIKENGLIQPVVLTHDRKLIAGESRIRACKSLGLSHIRAVFRGVLDEAQLHILECEENNARKDLTWQERCLSIDRTHRYKSTEAIMRGQKWGVRETGDLLKQGKTNIAYAVAISDELHANNKEVWAAETMMDAWKVVLSQREKEALKLIVTNATNKAAAAKSPTAPKGPIIPDVAFFDPTADTSIALFTPGVAGPSDTGEMPGDAAAQGPMQVPLSHMLLKENEHGTLFRMCELGADAVDHIITDPPYAIDMDNLAQEQGGKEDVDSVRKEHDVDENLDLLERFVKQSYITLRDRGFLVMWCDPTMWLMLNTLCNDTGFRVQRWPLVWHKTSACSNQSPWSHGKAMPHYYHSNPPASIRVVAISRLAFWVTRSPSQVVYGLGFTAVSAKGVKWSLIRLLGSDLPTYPLSSTDSIPLVLNARTYTLVVFKLTSKTSTSP
jgi:hypothetical protein